MSPAEVKAYLSREAKRVWPNVAKASDLPFPEYWTAQTKWLIFHSPRVGDMLMLKLISDVVIVAFEAFKKGVEPVVNVVPEEVRIIWEKAETERKHEAWDNAAELADAVRRRFSTPMRGLRVRHVGGLL